MGPLSRPCALLLAALLEIAGCARPPLPQLPDVHFPTVPDLPQEGPGFDRRLESGMLCAPVAVSNSLAWLTGNMSLEAQIATVNTLAGGRYMRTSPNMGTSPAGLMRGVERYLKEQGLGFNRLEYAGRRSVAAAYRAAQPLSLEWLHAGLSPRSAVWLNLGWYARVLPGVYRRQGGHWVTLVGVLDGQLVVHDPGPWQGRPEPLAPVAGSGRLVIGDEWGWDSQPLQLALPPDGSRGPAAIDGAVLLQLDP